MITGNDLKEFGEELIVALTSRFLGSSLSTLDKPGEYYKLDFGGGYYLKLCKWRQASVPAYLILFDKNNKYVFELDLSMVVFEESTYTWYLKSNISNDISKQTLEEYFGPPMNLPEPYRDEVLENKKTAHSGINVGLSGFEFSTANSINEIASNLQDLLEALLTAHGYVKPQGRLGSPVTESMIRQLRAVLVRRGQGRFRQNLLDIYDRKCAITGCIVEKVLDACHVVDFSISGNNSINNGVLLRTDLHTLFDDGSLKINPETLTIEISHELEESEYWSLHGQGLKSNFIPSKENLRLKYCR